MTDTVESVMAMADEYAGSRAGELLEYDDDFDLGLRTDKTNAAHATLRAAIERVVQENASFRHSIQDIWERAERAEAERDALRAEIERRDTAQVPDSGDT